MRWQSVNKVALPVLFQVSQTPSPRQCVPSSALTKAYGNPVALRIAALEPEHCSRAGAAIRHASATLLLEPASHR